MLSRDVELRPLQSCVQPHPQIRKRGGVVFVNAFIIHGLLYNSQEFSLYIEEYCALPRSRRNFVGRRTAESF